MLHLAPRITEAATYIRDLCPITPRAGIILGSGLGNFSSQLESTTTIPYADIPGFPAGSNVIGHKRELLCGTVEGVPVVTMAGRFHYYEGYPIDNVAFPVRVMKKLGIEVLVVSNASGGLNPKYKSADVVILDDHINLMFRNPLIGVNDENLGPRFPDMSSPYDPELIEQAKKIARENDFEAHTGVYGAMTGPTYETRAEYRMLRTLGADMVGMSTVPEVIVAVHEGLRVLALSAVTNLCRPDQLEETSGQEVVDAASIAEPKMTKIVRGVLAGL